MDPHSVDAGGPTADEKKRKTRADDVEVILPEEQAVVSSLSRRISESTFTNFLFARWLGIRRQDLQWICQSPRR